MFKGLFTALITPFRDGALDEDAFCRLVERQVNAGVNGVVPCGTTGEGATLTPEEQERVVALCVKTVAGRVPVIVGTGSNDTQKTIRSTMIAEKLGADAALIVTPYYNKPTQEGLFRHYKAVHDATSLPIVLYNVPGRTGVNLTPETVGRLSQSERIVAIKDATPDLLRPLKIRAAVKNGFSILSGEDATVVAFLAHGGDGVISVTANVAPELCVALQTAWRDKNWAEIERLRDLLLPLHEAMFVETNPEPAKYAASLIGCGDGTMRLPLCEISETSKRVVREAMVSVGLLGR